MIEKKIYYIWMGDKEKPEIFHKCYNSWKKNLPEYDIIEINESNFNLSKYINENRFFCLFPSWKAIVLHAKKPDDLQSIANHPAF